MCGGGGGGGHGDGGGGIFRWVVGDVLRGGFQVNVFPKLFIPC